MGLQRSRIESPDAQIQTKLLEEQFRQNELTSKILLMGDKGSGKNTIMKNLRISHRGQYQKHELKQYHFQIMYQIINTMQTLLQYCNKYQFSKQARQASSRINKIDDYHYVPCEEITEDIKILWNEPIIRETHFKFQQDNKYHLFENVEKIMQKDYIPTSTDILCLYQPSAKLRELNITLQEPLAAYPEIFHFINPSTNWIKYKRCFEDITALAFVLSLVSFETKLDDFSTLNDMNGLVSGYIRTSFDFNKVPSDLISVMAFFCGMMLKKKAMDPLAFCREVMRDPIFDNCPVICFLNKSDLFERKFNKNASWKAAPFDGKSRDDVINDIKKKIRSIGGGKRYIHFHVINAFDANILKEMTKSVRTIVLRRELGYYQDVSKWLD